MAEASAMEILEGRKLNEAVLKAFGPIESSADAYLHDRPCYEDGLLKYTASADLTWAVVDGLREKGWRILLRHHGEEAIATMYRGTDVRQAFHLHRNTAILNACLLAMEVDNGE